MVQSSWGGEQFELPAENEPRMPFKGWATEAAVRRLLQSSGYDLDKLITAAHSRSFKPVPLGIRTSIAFTNKLSRIQTGNVAGLLPGSDPKLADQVVVFSAHHDHFGIGEPDSSGDRIYHGALDNASGCAQVLAWRARLPRFRNARGAHCCFCLWQARSAGCSGRCTTPFTRPSRREKSRPI